LDYLKTSNLPYLATVTETLKLSEESEASLVQAIKESKEIFMSSSQNTD